MAIPIDEVGRVNVSVKVTGARGWRFRVWLMIWFFRLAALVAPKNVDVEILTK